MPGLHHVRAIVPALLFALILATGQAAVTRAQATPTAAEPTSAEEPEAVGSLRARPSPRPYDNPNARPSGAGVRGSRPLETTEEAGPPRLDDPVLQWLPEITAANTTTGTPLSLIAGIMRVESGGDPTIVSPQGAQGLMQVMPVELAAQGIAEAQWRDPATNVLAGAVILAQRSGGGWEGAAAYYFGIGCDYYGTCTYGYVVAVLGWANAYAALLGDPIWYDVGRIPAVPDASEESPTATPIPTTEPTAADPGGSPAPEPTSAPSETPTEEPSASPTEVPTEAPTEVPTEVPTEEPVPTDVPTESAADQPPAGDEDATPNG